MNEVMESACTVVIEAIKVNTDDIVTIALALWGAILSTIIFLNDRPKIKVGATKGFIVRRDGKKLQDTIDLNIKNSGRRSVTISGIKFKTLDRKFIQPLPDQYIKYDLPTEIKENSKAQAILPYKTLQETAKENKFSIQSVIFTDDLGKAYKFKLKKRLWESFYCDKRNMIQRLIDGVKERHR